MTFGCHDPRCHVRAGARGRGGSASVTVSDMRTRADVLVTATELMALIESGDAPAVLDVRWQLNEPDGRPAYLQGHIPGAVYVSLDDDLADHTRTGRGRHPLPSGGAVQAAARCWGLREGQPVVVYDDWNRAGSARAWWVLTAAGIPGVRILDGGLAAWKAVGGTLDAGPVIREPGDVTIPFDNLYAGGLPTLTPQELLDTPVVIDARAPERFRGDAEPVDAVAGHVPGARNLPSTSLLSDDGTFRSDTELAHRFQVQGIGYADSHDDGARPGVYCGSGVTAAVVVAALAAAGHDAALFPGSWSQWSSDPTLPVARGDE